MSFEEEFLVAVAAVDEKKKNGKKKPPLGSGCMTVPVIIATVLLVLVIFL